MKDLRTGGRESVSLVPAPTAAQSARKA